MSDSNSDSNNKGASKDGKPRRTLGLARSGGGDQGTVKQNFSHGRSKQVVVETRKRKFTRPSDKVADKPIDAAPEKPVIPPAVREAAAPEPTTPVAPVVKRPASMEPTPQPAEPEAAVEEKAPVADVAPKEAEPKAEAAPSDVADAAPAPAAKAAKPAPRDAGRNGATGNRSGGKGRSDARGDGRSDSRGNRGNRNETSAAGGRKLSNNEMQARLRALEEAKIRAVKDAEAAKIDAQRRAEIEARRKAKIEAEAQAAAEREERARQAADAKKREAAAKPAPRNTKAAPQEQIPLEPNTAKREGQPTRNLTPARRNDKPQETPRPSRPRGGDERRRGKLTLSTATGDNEGRSRSLSAMRRRQEKFKRAQNQEPREKVMREVTLPETITIQELAQRMSERSVDVIKLMMQQGQMMKPGDIIDADMAELIATEMGHTVKRVAESDVEIGIEIQDKAEDLKPRPPVVTIMGHVDHGKTSLLDALRQANVVDGEAGGITQHIGAYQVERDGNKITFIDTPGHAAFTAMRARGAQSTDIAILVVAADDSVMPQTIESINHAKAAGVPIIVAINKIDKPAADAAKVRTELLQHEVFVESMGGETLEVEVSATKGTNLDKLLDAINLQAELMDLKANPDRPAIGTVVEAQLDKGKGSVATVLVQAGTLKRGDIIVAGDVWGRVRALNNEHGQQVSEAGPSAPVEVLGLSGTPAAGDEVAVVENEGRAREISEYRERRTRDRNAARNAGATGSLEQMMTQLQTAGAKEFPLLIKGDVHGSTEAIIGALEKLNTDEVKVRVVHSAAGGITESDVSLAEASGAVIVAFNVRANKQAKDAAEAAGIEIRYYSIIYNLIDDVKAAMSGMLAPERRETFVGYANILEVFNITKVGKVAGCRVTEGKVERGNGVRLLRDDVVIHEGMLKTLKRFKDEVPEVHGGQECGMAFEKYEDIRAGDVIECFRVEHIERSL